MHIKSHQSIGGALMHRNFELVDASLIKKKQWNCRYGRRTQWYSEHVRLILLVIIFLFAKLNESNRSYRNLLKRIDKNYNRLLCTYSRSVRMSNGCFGIVSSTMPHVRIVWCTILTTTHHMARTTPPMWIRHIDTERYRMISSRHGHTTHNRTNCFTQHAHHHTNGTRTQSSHRSKRHIWLKSGHFFVSSLSRNPNKSNDRMQSIHLYILNLAFDYRITNLNGLPGHFVEWNFTLIALNLPLIELKMWRNGNKSTTLSIESATTMEFSMDNKWMHFRWVFFFGSLWQWQPFCLDAIVISDWNSSVTLMWQLENCTR